MNKVMSGEARIQFLKFLGVGVMNTALSLIVIYALMWAGVGYRVANVAGYVAGVINSFLWNKHWVFRSRGDMVREAVRFGLCFAVCYAIQYLLLILMAERWMWNAYLAQLIAMGAYTVCNFVLNRLFTFRQR